jgi:hypothetical protein
MLIIMINIKKIVQFVQVKIIINCKGNHSINYYRALPHNRWCTRLPPQ